VPKGPEIPLELNNKAKRARSSFGTYVKKLRAKKFLWNLTKMLKCQ